MSQLGTIQEWNDLDTPRDSRGRRDIHGGHLFFNYRTRSGARHTAMVLDASEELRTREESNLRQMLAGARIAAADLLQYPQSSVD